MPAGKPGRTLTLKGGAKLHPNDTYIDQSPDALRLTLVEGWLDADDFHVYDSQSLLWNGVSIDARVIGASHIISYSIGDVRLHEVFACINPTARTSEYWASIMTYSWSGLVNPIEHRLDGLTYRFQAFRVPWSDPEPQIVESLLQRCRDQPTCDGFGFVQHFPQGECLVSPKTIIVGHRDPEGIVIETAHSYPNVRGLVLSRTELHAGGK